MTKTATTTSSHAPGTVTLESEPTTVAMTDTVEYILDQATDLGLDDVEVEWYEDDGEQVFNIFTHQDGTKYGTEVSHKNGEYEPKSIFYRGVDRSLERLKERLPDQ